MLSQNRREYYARKQRRMAFFIVENDIRNEDPPPVMSALIGKEGLCINTRLSMFDGKKEIEKWIKSHSLPSEKRYEPLRFPSLPIQWRNNFIPIIPKAVFDQV